jgi:tetratricopeptide (TPR) repeat protein
LNAGLLLSGGEAQRAADLITIYGQCPNLPPAIRNFMGLLLRSCGSAGVESDKLVNEGIKLYDAGDYAAALKKHDAAIALWPQNGFAHYERGLTLSRQHWEAAGIKVPTKGVTANGPKPPPEALAAYALARQHHPFQIQAYQGTDQAVINGFMVMAQTGLPAWQKIRAAGDAAAPDEVLTELAEACQQAQQHELALAVRQIIVARRGRYDAADHPFITKSLQALASGEATDATLKRLAGGKLMFRQLIKQK